MTTLNDIASNFLPAELLEVAGAYNALSLANQSAVFSDIVEGSKAFTTYPNTGVNPFAVHYAVLSGRTCVDLLLAAHNAGLLVEAMRNSAIGGQHSGPSNVDLCAAATVAVYTARAAQSADTAAKTTNANLAASVAQDAADSAQRVAAASGALSSVWASARSGEAAAYAGAAYKRAIALRIPAGGYYRPDMTDEQQRALSATLDPAIRAKLLADALALIPPCETPAFKAAVEWDIPHATGYTQEQIQTIADGWIGDFDKMQAAYDAIKPCAPTPAKKSSGIGEAVVAFLAVVAIGLAVRRARRKPG